MDDTLPYRRTCPTRADGVEPLLVHSIGAEVCAARQASCYHKCWSCVHNTRGARVAAVPPAALAEVVLQPVLRSDEVVPVTRVSLRAV